MRSICPALAMCVALAMCAASVQYVNLPGYAFKTDPKCQRTASKMKFDRKCDYPRLGFPGFTPPTTIFGA